MKDSLRQQSGGSLLSWEETERKEEEHEIKEHSFIILLESQREREVENESTEIK